MENIENCEKLILHKINGNQFSLEGEKLAGVRTLVMLEFERKIVTIRLKTILLKKSIKNLFWNCVFSKNKLKVIFSKFR